MRSRFQTACAVIAARTDSRCAGNDSTTLTGMATTCEGSVARNVVKCGRG